MLNSCVLIVTIFMYYSDNVFYDYVLLCIFLVHGYHLMYFPVSVYFLLYNFRFPGAIKLFIVLVNILITTAISFRSFHIPLFIFILDKMWMVPMMYILSM